MRFAYKLLLCFLIFTPDLKAAVCEPFSPEEKTVFSITYLGATAGSVSLGVDRAEKAWKFSALAKTESIFIFFYSVNNAYEALTNDISFTTRHFIAHIDESRQTGTTTQLFSDKKLHFDDNRLHKKKGQILKIVDKEIPVNALDVLTALQSVRREELSLGKTVEREVVIGEEAVTLRLKVEAEEDLNTKIGKVPSWVMNASLIKDGAPKQIPESTLWIAKSGPHQILKIKAKIKIGSVIAYLRSYQAGNPLPNCLSN